MTKNVKVKIKDGIEAIVFDPNNPPDCAMEVSRSMDDASGIFHYKEWQVHGEQVKEGDLILYAEYGNPVKRVVTMVIPNDAIGKLVEIVSE